jgi:uncharacterized Fe-S radical SAM superfamily protein PflX
MKNITIKSVTHCPTCNSECKVNGGTTQYYVPIKKYTEEDLLHAFREGVLLPNSQIGIMEDIFKQVVHSLNKQD